MHTITQIMQVGIYDNCEAVARIYEDRSVVTWPEVKWIGNSGSYHEGKYRITGKAHQDILAAMQDDCVDTAWQIIGDNLGGY